VNGPASGLDGFYLPSRPVKTFPAEALLRFRLSGGPVTAVFDDGIPVRAHVTADGTLAIELAEGREVLVYAGERPDLDIASWL